MDRQTVIRRQDAPTLYVDYDGVLNAGSGVVETDGRVSLDTGRPLFEHAGYLVDALRPYPTVQIVVTSSWLKKLGEQATISYLPTELRHRVIGTTAGITPRLCELRDGSERTWQILRHAWGLRLRTWLAIDDRVIGVPNGYEHHFLPTTTSEALGSGSVRQHLQAWLAKHAAHLDR